MPNQPLFAGGGSRLIPTTSLGFEARGAFAVGEDSKVTYSAFVSNGPRLVTTGSKQGQLNFSNFSDSNNAKTIGARIGFLPFAGTEIAYAVSFSDDVAATGFRSDTIQATIQDVSVGFKRQIDEINGMLDARAEFVFSDVDDVNFGGGVFDNSRTGGYAEVAYRPTLADGIWKDFEGVFRWDFLDNPSDSSGAANWDEDRYTFGINYWLNPSTVWKFAYQIDDVDDPTNAKSSSDAFMMQLAMGF